ncbi:MAG TPA: porin [Luteolibacter sp.]|nr:porin [Luteolibacter sp.]
MRTNNTPLTLAAAMALGLQLHAIAGSETPPAITDTAAGSSGDWCEWLQSKPGTLYKNPENPWLQSFQIEGRFQYQLGYLDGSDVNGDDWSETHDEYRRFRLGLKSDFLRYFGAKFVVNLVNDQRNVSGGGDLDWGYDSIDEALLSFDIKKAFGAGPLDSLKLNYGRHKFVVGQETRTSSTKLLTVERSAIANKVYGSYRPTGLSLDGALGKWTFTGALYSSTTDGADNEEFSGWQDDVVYYASAGYQVSDELVLGVDFVYNNADAVDEDSIIGYRWATSINAQYDAGSWGIVGDFIYGDNGGSGMTGNADRQGDFWGLVVMPYYWIVDEKLQLVGQYQYGGADESEGIRINSRYGRGYGTGGTAADVNSGRGDEHHSLYAGLNWYLCGHNAKIQGGIEYQTMDTPAGDFDTLTYLLAFRTFF